MLKTRLRFVRREGSDALLSLPIPTEKRHEYLFCAYLQIPFIIMHRSYLFVQVLFQEKAFRDGYNKCDRLVSYKNEGNGLWTWNWTRVSKARSLFHVTGYFFILDSKSH